MEKVIKYLTILSLLLTTIVHAQPWVPTSYISFSYMGGKLHNSNSYSNTKIKLANKSYHFANYSQQQDTISGLVSTNLHIPVPILNNIAWQVGYSYDLKDSLVSGQRLGIGAIYNIYLPSMFYIKPYVGVMVWWYTKLQASYQDAKSKTDVFNSNINGFRRKNRATTLKAGIAFKPDLYPLGVFIEYSFTTSRIDIQQQNNTVNTQQKQQGIAIGIRT